MTVKITYKKYLDRGEKKVRILKIEGVIEKNNLPIKYLEKTPYFYRTDDGSLVCDGNNNYRMFDINGVSLTNETFEWLVKTMKEAGDRLHKINQEIREERKKWCGKRTITI